MSASATSGTRTAPKAPAARPRRRRAASGGAPFDTLFDAAPAAPAAPLPSHRPVESQTFDEIIAGAWEELSAHRAVTCPVCRAAAMRPRYGAGQGAVGGRCGDCGSVLG